MITSKNEFANKACYFCSPKVASAFNLAVLQGGHFHRKCNRNGLRWSSAAFARKERGWYRAIRTVAIALSLRCHFAPHAQCARHATSLVAMCVRVTLAVPVYPGFTRVSAPQYTYVIHTYMVEVCTIDQPLQSVYIKCPPARVTLSWYFSHTYCATPCQSIPTVRDILTITDHPQTIMNRQPCILWYHIIVSLTMRDTLTIPMQMPTDCQPCIL